MKRFIFILLLIAGPVAGWFLHGQFGGAHPTSAVVSGERKVLFYQSAMHPWIKSDKPGRCTICGMELVPVYEGDKGIDNATAGVVSLTQSQIQVVNVQTVEARVQKLARALMVAGIINENTSRHRVLSAYVDGRIDKLHVNYMGAEVTEGQPLADLYSPMLLQSEREYRQLTGDLRKSTAMRLRQMGLTPSQIEALDHKPGDALTSQILSPVGGTVVDKNVSEGQYVVAGEKLFEIADFSVMWFQFRAYEQDMPWIAIGQPVTVTTPSLPGKSFEGKITFIDPNFDEATRSTKVRVELPNPLVDGHRALLNRLYADGAVKIESPGVLTVPKSAVIQTGHEAVAYVDKGGGLYALAPLKIGRRGDALLEVLSGLAVGDKVVTNGNLLIDGQAEMNRTFASPASAVPGPVKALTDAQSRVVTDFVKVADAMANALATDDLAAFHKASEPVMTHSGALIASLRLLKDVVPGLEVLDKARHIHGGKDLHEARVAFHQFSMAAVHILEPLRAAQGMPDFQVWECRMVDKVIDGAPKFGYWVQTGARPGSNPFFGNEMQDCAKEIKTGDKRP